MELFILGIVAGAALGVLYTKRDEVKKAFGSPEFKGKVNETKRASKRVLDEAKSFLASEAPKRRGRKPGVKAKATTTATKTDKVAKSSKTTAEKGAKKVGRKAKASTNETAADTSTGRKIRAKKADTATKVATPRKPRKPRTPKVADTAVVAPSTDTAQQ